MKEAANPPLARVGTPEDVANAVVSSQSHVKLDHRRSPPRGWRRASLSFDRFES